MELNCLFNFLHVIYQVYMLSASTMIFSVIVKISLKNENYCTDLQVNMNAFFCIHYACVV